MNRMQSAALWIAAAALVTGCSPTLTVNNNTRFAIRAVVSQEGSSDVLSPSPGESSSVDARPGTYSVTAIPDQEWIEWAKLTRKALNDQLADSDRLTGAQLLDVINRLKDIATKMTEFQAAAGSSASCSGTTDEEHDSWATVSAAANGSLSVVCSQK